MQFSQLALGTTTLTKTLLRIINKAIVLGEMIQPDINYFKENHEFGANTSNWAKLSDQERRQLLWNVSCNCPEPLMCTDRRFFTSQIRVKSCPKQLQQILRSVLIELARKPINPCCLTIAEITHTLLKCFKINQSTEQRHCSKRYPA